MFVAIIFILLLFVVPFNFLNVDIANLLTATTVLFGILAGFFIAATLTNYFRLQSLIATETAKLISLRNFCIALEPELKKEMDEALDKYIISAFDFELINYIDQTWKEFNNIIKISDKIKRRDSDLFATMMEIKGELVETRQELILTSRQIIGLSGWITLIVLAAANISLLYSIRSASVVSSVFTVVISSAICLVLFLLYEIDNNIFAEEKLAFVIYQRVFKEIGKSPYYPEVSIKTGRVKLIKGETYRIGRYKNFPKSLEKTIEIFKA